MLRFIAMTILAYFIFRWLDRFFGGGSASRSRKTSATEGSASAKSKFSGEQPTKSKVSNSVGEYVEYEEVKDDSKESGT